MATKRDRDQILDSLETEFRSDLSIHLYSTFLLHQINPQFPPRKWSSWPMAFEKVPDPKSEKLYVDQYDEYGKIRAAESTKEIDRPPQGNDNDDNEGEEEGEEKDEDEYETVSSPRDCLAIEIKAVIEKRIGDRLKNPVSSNISETLLNLITDQVIPKVDLLLETLIQYRLDASKKKSSQIKRQLTWQDVLRAHLETSSDLEGTRKLFESCVEHFFNVRYKYEFEEQEDQNSDIGEEQHSDVEEKNDGNNGTRSTIEPKANENSIDFDLLNEEYESAQEEIPGNQMVLLSKKEKLKKNGFSISSYLSKIESGSEKPDVASQIAKEQVFQDEMIQQRNVWFLNRLKSVKETRSLSMERKSTAEIDIHGLNQEQERALLHGGIQLDEESYYL